MSKTQETLVLIMMVTAFGLGYFFRNAQPSLVSQTAQVKDDHTVITTVTTKQKDGTKTVQTIDSTVKTNTKETVKQSTQAKAQLNVSALAGYDFNSSRLPTPVYGVAVTKQVLGSLTVGAFGLTNGTVGVSLGVNF